MSLVLYLFISPAVLVQPLPQSPLRTGPTPCFPPFVYPHSSESICQWDICFHCFDLVYNCILPLIFFLPW